MSDLWKRARKLASDAGKATLEASQAAYEKGQSAVVEQRRKTISGQLKALKELEAYTEVDVSDWPEEFDQWTLDELLVFRKGLKLDDEINWAGSKKIQAENEAKQQADLVAETARVYEETLAFMGSLLSDPAAVLRISIEDKVSKRNLKMLRDQYTDKVAGRQTGVDTSTGMAATQSIIGTGVTAARRGSISTTIELGVPSSRVERALTQFSAQEIAVLQCASILRAHMRYDEKTYQSILMALAWADGQGYIDPGGEDKYRGVVQEVAGQLLSAEYPNLSHIVARLLGEYQAILQSEDSDVSSSLKEVLSVGQKWGDLNDLPEHRLREFEDGDLVLGGIGDIPVGFNGQESLVTFGPPGRGKSQAHALLNLLTYNGPMIVLDFKGELFRASAGYRQSALDARILRFSLMKGETEGHCYNPLAFLSRDPDDIWDEARGMAMDLIDEPIGKDAYWTNSARDLVAVLIGSMLLQEDAEDTNFSELMAKLALGGEKRQQQFEAIIERAGSQFVMGLRNRAQGFLDMKASEKTLENIYQHARQALSCFESPLVHRITQESDWSAEDLRDGATTLYLTLPFEQIEPFAPLIRVIIGQHIKRLTQKQPEEGALPLTFLLDELPQLGNFDAVVKAVEIGRSYGLRVWSFAQHPQQFESSFERWKVLVDSPAVRCYMNPDLDAAHMLSQTLGEVSDIFTGVSKPLASPAELMGPEYEDKIIVLQAGSHVYSVTKLMAYEVFSDRLDMPYQFHPSGLRTAFLEADLERDG